MNKEIKEYIDTRKGTGYLNLNDFYTAGSTCTTSPNSPDSRTVIL
jgi:hypothetical protein